MKWLPRKLGMGSALALVGVVALAGGALSLAFHSTSSSSSTQRSAATDRGEYPPGPGFRRFRRLTPKQILQRREDFHAALAKELGVSTEKVDNAFRTLFSRRLDRAVANGNLTRKQADRLLSCYDKANCRPPFAHRFRFRGSGPPPGPPPAGGPMGLGPPPPM